MPSSNRRNEIARSRGYSNAYAERKAKSAWSSARRYGEFRRLTKGLRPSEPLARKWLEAFDEPSGSRFRELQGQFLKMLHKAFSDKWLKSMTADLPKDTKLSPDEIVELMSKEQTPYQQSLFAKAAAKSPMDNARAGTALDWAIYRAEYGRLHPK